MNKVPDALPFDSKDNAFAAVNSSSQRREIIDAYHLVSDLMQPNPLRYWAELLLSGVGAWLAFVLAVAAPLGSITMWLALIAAVLLGYRASVFIHELTHRTRRELPGFHMAWNLFIGVPMLLPSVMYEGVHGVHHAKNTYGTPDDPEYLPMARQPHLAMGLVLMSFLAPAHLALRFLIDAPISWIIPPFRRLLERRGSAFVVNPFYCRTMTPDERRRLIYSEIIVLAVWWPLLAATVLGWLPWHWLMLWYGMYVVISAINHIRELVAHRYESGGQALEHAGQFRDSLNTPGGWWTVLWAPLGLRFHALHHLFPRLPYHNLARAHDRLNQLLPADGLYKRSYNPSFAAGLLRLLGYHRA